MFTDHAMKIYFLSKKVVEKTKNGASRRASDLVQYTIFKPVKG